MNSVAVICVILLGESYFMNAQGQRVAPGVPPQHYQQQPPQPHQVHQPEQIHQQQQVHQQPQIHQQQIHQQQVPQQPNYQQQQQQQQQQFQQVPVQQVPVQQVPVQHQVPNQHVPVQQQQQQHQQQQQQQQQVPHGHGHHHGSPQPGQILNAANMEHEKAHIQEHLEIPMDTSKMSDQELQFHYFKMHDADNNNKLDGCELIKSLIHWHEQGNKDPAAPHAEEKLFKDDELVALIDPILGMDDMNKDGFIDYPEFIQAQQKAAATGRP